VIQAIILAGGRATRLDGYDKADLRGPDGVTLLRSTVDALRTDAKEIVVVGPKVRGGIRGVKWAREDPPFSGPARAIAAGLAALDDVEDAWVLVVACDMPYVEMAIWGLVLRWCESGGGIWRDPGSDGLVSVDEEFHEQWLCALYRRSALVAACAQLEPGGSGESVRWLVGDLVLKTLPTPPGSTEDIDTMADMRSAGYTTGRAVANQE